LEAAFVEDLRFANIADIKDIALLEHVAAISDGHQLHLAAAHLSRQEVREHLHIVEVHAAIQIRDTVGRGVTVMVGPYAQARPG
jgi:hypothetical protein